ncbi:hypothetical protein HIM_09433 [Hirsutella minnesotensis 3608]|uniref:Hydantoin racemase n=1 Tax=Hirsutella minnesotensis 3608 TaxID=1043627 RepID=A0A0F7ZSD6_9HYPO|nr:hypothetical protein HIM_09433 [Hirsutella minnesotensis 3608]
MKILLLNPNSSTAMTHAMTLAAQSVSVTDSLQIDPYTAPSSAPASINNDSDIEASTLVVQEDLIHRKSIHLGDYDAVLVACYSAHTLVPQLANQFPNLAVTGIFEASILTGLSLISSTPNQEQWGIVTTGEFWESHLARGISDFLGRDGTGDAKFAGVFSTGLTAGDFHTVSPDEVREKLKAATARLLHSGNVTCVAMGCGGMAGLEDIIRSTARQVYGQERAAALYVVDGVKAGILQLFLTVHSRRVFR